jgi:enoyl-CoA hydratase/carnithine racemase
MTQPVLFEEQACANGKSIGVALLNVEKTLNSLTLEMVELMLEKLQRWQSDDNIAAVFIHAAGEKAFCAGGDVKALHESATATPGGPCIEAETFYEREYRLDYLLHVYAKPIICWGHGIVMGGGLGVFAGCEHRVVTEKTRIAMPEVTIALFPDVGGSYFLNRMPGLCGRFLAFTAASINGADSLYTGLADYFIAHANKESVLAELQKIAFSGSADDDSKKIAQLLRANEDACIKDMPVGNLESHQHLIDELCAGEDIESILMRFDTLDTDEKWMQRAKSGIAGGSPLALKRIFRQLALADGLSLEDVFKSEMLLVTTVVRDPEFAEGVRALLIDKDQNPQWQFKTLADVPEDFLEAFFIAPWPENPLADL